MNDTIEYIRKLLFDNADEQYRKFHSSLMPDVAPEKVIGVRTPVLRALAKRLYKERRHTDFMKDLPHKYYEENNLHAYFIELIPTYDEAVAQLDRFLPYVDNWATCDTMKPRVFAKNTDRLFDKTGEWLSGDGVFTVRFAVKTLMEYFITGEYARRADELVVKCEREEYYVSMARAWYFATALTKRYADTVNVIENRRLDIATHNRTIQKALDSRQISSEAKTYLKSLKIKNGEKSENQG